MKPYSSLLLLFYLLFLFFFFFFFLTNAKCWTNAEAPSTTILDPSANDRLGLQDKGVK